MYGSKDDHERCTRGNITVQLEICLLSDRVLLPLC